MSARLSRTISEADIVLFTTASGDGSAVCISEEFAQAASSFEGCIADDMLRASVISAAIVGRLPAPGTIDIGQPLRSKAPVRPGDAVPTTVTVKELFPDKRQARLSTICTVGDTVVVDGDAMVMPTSSAAPNS